MTEKHIIHDSRWIGDVLPPDLKDTVFETLRAELEPHWSEMSHKGGAVPRLVCIQGSIDPETGAQPMYRHPADEQPPLMTWTPTVNMLKDIVSERLQQPINHALIQCYRNGKDYISPHADKTLDIQRGSAVVNLSIGKKRTMILKSKKGSEKAESIRVPMDHGSLFVLGWDTNRLMTHQIKQDKRLDMDKTIKEIGAEYGGMRISLTFRTVSTFWRPDGTLYGQGAPNQYRPANQAQEDELLKAFSTENISFDYDWDAIYGKGFSVINFKITNSAQENEKEAGDGESETTMDRKSKEGKATEPKARPIPSEGPNDQYSKKTAKSPKVALVAIDLLNDFLGDDPSFFMAKRKSPVLDKRDALLQRIGVLADEIRDSKGPVIFVKAIYGEVPPGPHPNPHKQKRNGLPFNSDFLSGTHSGKETCSIRGTPGAELHPAAAALMKEGDMCLEKNYYSSFTETTLHPLLQNMGVTHLVICGVLTNYCVAATLRDAYHLGYQVLLPPDGVAQTTKKNVLSVRELPCIVLYRPFRIHRR